MPRRAYEYDHQYGLHIVKAIDAEIDRVRQVRALLSSSEAPAKHLGRPPKATNNRGVSTEARNKIAAAMKAH